VILATASAATALLKVGELEERIAVQEAAIKPRDGNPGDEVLGLL
jgi:uncharacterized small protein (DUF1192 family)